MASEPSDDTPMYALAVHPSTERVALYEGPHSFSYPITFDGILGDDLEVDSEFRRTWFEMYGWRWVIARQDSEEGGVIEETVEELRDGVEILDAFRNGLVDLGGSVCNYCDNAFAAEGSGGTLGPTCPECGHPANDPKVLDG